MTNHQFWKIALGASICLLALGVDAIFITTQIKKDSTPASVGMLILGPALFGLAFAMLVAAIKGVR
jgi:hypothetical protein